MSSFLSLYFFHFVSKGLASTDLEDLLEDIKVYMELEQGRNVEFWKVKITAGWPFPRQNKKYQTTVYLTPS